MALAAGGVGLNERKAVACRPAGSIDDFLNESGEIAADMLFADGVPVGGRPGCGGGGCGSRRDVVDTAAESWRVVDIFGVKTQGRGTGARRARREDEPCLEDRCSGRDGEILEAQTVGLAGAHVEARPADGNTSGTISLFRVVVAQLDLPLYPLVDASPRRDAGFIVVDAQNRCPGWIVVEALRYARPTARAILLEHEDHGVVAAPGALVDDLLDDAGEIRRLAHDVHVAPRRDRVPIHVRRRLAATADVAGGGGEGRGISAVLAKNSDVGQAAVDGRRPEFDDRAGYGGALGYSDPLESQTDNQIVARYAGGVGNLELRGSRAAAVVGVCTALTRAAVGLHECHRVSGDPGALIDDFLYDGGQIVTGVFVVGAPRSGIPCHRGRCPGAAGHIVAAAAAGGEGRRIRSQLSVKGEIHRAAVTVARGENNPCIENGRTCRNGDRVETHTVGLIRIHVDLAGRDDIAAAQLFFRIVRLTRHLPVDAGTAHRRGSGDDVELLAQKIHGDAVDQFLGIVAAAVDLHVDIGAATGASHDDGNVLVDVGDGEQDRTTGIGEAHQADVDVVGVIENDMQCVLHAVQAVLAHSVHAGHAARCVEDEEHVRAHARRDVDVAEINLGVISAELNREAGNGAERHGCQQMVPTSFLHFAESPAQAGCAPGSILVMRVRHPRGGAVPCYFPTSTDPLAQGSSPCCDFWLTTHFGAFCEIYRMDLAVLL